MNRKTTFPASAFIGFDSLTSTLDHIAAHAKDSYPPHNVVKLSDNYYILELAIAGFDINDLSIEVRNNVLTVVGSREPRRAEDTYIHRGISTRKFSKSFRLSEYTSVREAKISKGILIIDIDVNIPTEDTVTTIKIV